MKTIKSITLQSAITLTLMTGNITGPSNAEFYEDDASFHKTSAQLTSGWGWGFNKAYAACEDEEEQSVDDDATAPDECIDVIGEELDESSYDVSVTEESSYGGNSGGGGGGPSDEGEGDNEPPKAEEEIEQYKEDVDDLVWQCKATYTQYNAGIVMLCSEFSYRLLKYPCSGMMTHLQLRAIEWCTEMGKQKKARECK